MKPAYRADHLAAVPVMRPPDPQTCERPRLTTKGAREAALQKKLEDTVDADLAQQFRSRRAPIWPDPPGKAAAGLLTQLWRGRP